MLNLSYMKKTKGFYRRTKRKKVNDADGYRILITIVVVLLMIIVGAETFAKLYFTTERNVMGKLNFLADTYYREYYYDRFSSTIVGDRNAAFEKYSEYGFAPVYLRQLLSFNSGKYADYRKFFEGHCDTNTTTVYYYPRAPYGKNDFETKLVHTCKFD